MSPLASSARLIGSPLAGAPTGPRGEEPPLPQLLIVASGASRSGTSLTSAILAASTSALGRDLLLIDACQSGTLLPMLGAQSSFVAVSPTLTVAEVGVAALVPLFEAPPVSTGDAVLVDAGARLGTVLGALAAALAVGHAPGLLVVTGTDASQIAAAYALIKVAAERGLTTTAEVVIVGGDAIEARDAFALLTAGVRRFLDRPLVFAAHVPEDPSLALALSAGMPVHDAATGSPAALALASLATRWAASSVSTSPSAPVPPPNPGRPAAAVPARRPAVPGLSGSLAYAAAPAR